MKRNVPFLVQSFQVRVISDNNQVPLLLEKKLPQNLGFPGGSDGKESACSAGDPGSIPGWKDPLEKRMATHSSTLSWKIPGTEEPDSLQSMGSQKVRHD